MTLLKCLAVPTRRVQLAIGFSILFYFVAFQTQFAQNHISHWPYAALSKGTDLPARRPYDSWQPPYDWSGKRVVWDNFDNLNEQFAASIENLESSSGPIRQIPKDFPKYNQHNQTVHDGSSIVSCKGPSGGRFNETTQDLPRRYTGKPRNWPTAPIGSSSLVGFEQEACYDRFGRHEPYGVQDVKQHGQNQYDRHEVPFQEGEINWDTIDWADLQTQCYQENLHRFDTSAREPYEKPPPLLHEEDPGLQQKVPRTAIVFRAHQDYQFTEEVRRNLRAIITELSLYTGGEYAAYLFVHMRDLDREIWSSQEEYERAVWEYVPPEFRGITVLWNQASWRDEYPKIKDDFQNVHLSQWFSMQFFQRHYPEFDYYWNWEMDIRYTGHYLEFIQAADRFTKSQPRKGMWERNERFYLPQVHGTYDQFRDTVQARYVKDGNGTKTSDSSIWGPHFPAGKINEEQEEILDKLDTKPPVASPDADNFEWGVGEPADFMTFLPMFNPHPTEYINKDYYTNYDDMEAEDVYRRTTIVTLLRFSGRLLRLMEAENTASESHHMSSETWPHSIALHYGLKSIYVPHGIYMENDWPAAALDFVFNNGDQGWTLKHHPQRETMNPHGEGSGGPESPFGIGYENGWERSTWYYQNRLGERLYKRWMGWEFDNIGGPEWEKQHGRYCLPPMLIHPIKSLFGPEEGLL